MRVTQADTKFTVHADAVDLGAFCLTFYRSPVRKMSKATFTFDTKTGKLLASTFLGASEKVAEQAVKDGSWSALAQEARTWGARRLGFSHKWMAAEKALVKIGDMGRHQTKAAQEKARLHRDHFADLVGGVATLLDLARDAKAKGEEKEYAKVEKLITKKSNEATKLYGEKKFHSALEKLVSKKVVAETKA